MKFSRICVLLVVMMLTMLGSVYAQDLKSNLDLQLVIAPVATSTDQISAAISTANYKTSLLGLYCTAQAQWAAGVTAEVIVTHCASSTGSFTPVGAYDINGITPDADGVVFTLDSATTVPTMQEIQYIGRMPYFKVAVDYSGVLNVATPTFAVFAVHGGKIIEQ